MAKEGTSKQVAASLLGHADTTFLERTYCHPQDVAKQQAANLMQDLLSSQNPCYVAFMKNKNRKAKKAGQISSGIVRDDGAVFVSNR